MSDSHTFTGLLTGNRINGIAGVALSLFLHSLVFFWSQWNKTPEFTSQEPPAAIMVEWAASPEAPESPADMPVGLARQQSAEMEKVTEEKEQMDSLAVKDAAIATETVKKKKSEKDGKKLPRQPVQEQSNDARPDAAVSLASPFSQKNSTRVAAPFSSDSVSPEAKVSWESLVKGHLNRFKNYPADARRRNRTGTARVTFTVDASGRVSGIILDSSSGTSSLDREALAVITRAQPLPEPPVELLSGGRHVITIPINFSLAEIRSR
ncbi:energy transducer TonB [Intestinirhabdus alba]|jgi:protein TonB|uniref:TonB family protein n=1 Tax=Intestinirhabdus alba TaxID=2899544 RepID=A0A6L6IUC9_9ENTR|nr:energy transducer TonB [Intestinirhabdus alba]MTH48620.1 TonB family protein [Intestinirhabdus alba]